MNAENICWVVLLSFELEEAGMLFCIICADECMTLNTERNPIPICTGFYRNHFSSSK